jgi:type VI secretion system VasD/TssJ family lipoprotein
MMQMREKRRRAGAMRILILSLLPVLAAGGCVQLCSLGMGCESTADLVVEGTPDLNAGQAVTIVLYQLSGDVAFQQMPLERFWQEEAEELSGEIVEREPELLLFPGEARAVRVFLHEDARFLGIAANLRDPRTNGWRSLLAVRDLQGRRALVRVGANDLTVSVP